MKRLLLTLAAVFGLAASASAQLTPAPFVLQQYSDAAGVPLSAGGMCLFRAGTSTLASSFTTAAGSVANANPLLLNSAGRPSSNGFFLTPGSSYKLVLVDFTGIGVPSCSAINGTTLWTQDNIDAVPSSASVVDVAGTAGESIAAGEAVFLSTGAGSLNAGQWYRTDADFTYRSAYAAMVGVAPSAIVSGASGTMRVSGTVTTSGLAAGSAYFAGATAGALVTTPPTNAIRVGQAISATVLVVGYTDVQAPRGPPCGRLTLTTGVPVTVADVTAATTLFYAPYGGCNTASTFDGVQWNQTGFAQVSIAVPATTSQMYDVFLFDNAGVLALELTAWTNDTTRATALTTQNGVYVRTGALTRLYLGSFRTTAVSGQTEDSATKRYVWNYYQRVPRLLQRLEATVSWTYTTAVWRQANAAAANQVEIVVGVQESVLSLSVNSAAVNGTAVFVNIGIGEDSTTTPATGATGGNLILASASGYFAELRAALVKAPAVGRHYYAWLEASEALGSTTWRGANTTVGAYTVQGQLVGTWWS